MKNHRESLMAACRAFGTSQELPVPMERAINAYLEARGAVLATSLTAAWLIESMVDGRCVNSEVAFIPTYAEKSKAFGCEVTPLHAALKAAD